LNKRKFWNFLKNIGGKEVVLNIDNLIKSLTGYIETKVELTKIEAKEAISKIAAKIMLYISLFIISQFTIAFISLTVGTILNEILDSRFAGFAIVSVVYILILIVIFIKKDAILKNISEKTLEMIDNK
jgi:uncharacterized membrane protein YqjE